MLRRTVVFDFPLERHDAGRGFWREALGGVRRALVGAGDAVVARVGWTVLCDPAGLPLWVVPADPEGFGESARTVGA